MRNNYFRTGATLMVAAVLGLSSCEQEPQMEQTVNIPDQSGQSALIEGQYIVVLKKDAASGRLNPAASFEEKQAAVKSMVLSMFSNARLSEDMLYRVYGNSILGFAAKMDEATLMRIKKDPNVDFVEQDRVVMFAPPWAGGGGDDTSGEVVPPGIIRVGGGGVYSGGGRAFVIDSGIDLDHPDLNVSAESFNAFKSGRDAKSADDGNGHGTHVAGTIAAIDNSIGVVGVAPGAEVVAVKVLDSRGSGSYSGVVEGVNWVAGKGKAGDVANMSLGGPVSDALDQAIKNAAASSGVAFFLAAGNDGDDSNKYSPARVNGTNIYTISAMDASDVFASFSNWGNPPVDFCAPGVSIKSTWKDGGYNTISGTSMATPHAAGVSLIKNGGVGTDGTFVKNDPDGDADKVISAK